MNDMTALQTFRAAEAEPDALALARGRRRLLEHADAGGRTAVHRPRSRRTAMVRGGVVLGLSAAAVLGGVVVGSDLTVGVGGDSAQAAEVLERAAVAAMAQPPGPALGPGQVLYTHTVWDLGVPEPGDELSTGAQCVQLHEQWENTDGDVRVHSVEGLTPESAGDPAAPAVDDPTCEGAPEEYTEEFPAGSVVDVAGEDEASARLDRWGNADAAFVAGLPTDPGALYERARVDARGTALPDDQTFTLLTDLALSHSPHLAPELKAAVLRAIALVPDVELTGEGDTLLGDRGVVVSRVEDVTGTRREVVFDPATGKFLGERAVDLHGGLPGTVRTESASRAAVVDAFGERP